MKADALSRACPSCAEPMRRRGFGRKPLGSVDVDLCFACHCLWFDQYESAQLTPGAILELFRAIHEHRSPARPLADNARCPVCRARLVHTQDIQRTNRIAYLRCPNGDGRLTTFVQFLREKNFVRELSDREVERLKATIVQVRCSSCGGAVDLARDAACPYCRAPVAILDPEAVHRAIEELSAAERKRLSPPDPIAPVEAMLAGQATARAIARFERPPNGLDLIDAMLQSLFSDKAR